MSNIRVPNTNSVIIGGRLTRDVELAYTSGGQAYAKSCVACDDSYKNKSGEKIAKTVFMDWVIWGTPAEWASELKKGDPVLVTGKLQTEEWEKEGKKNSKTSINAITIHSLEWKDKDTKSEPAPKEKPAQTEPLLEDDIPF
jgi:single-strand DNA-binding protein